MTDCRFLLLVLTMACGETPKREIAERIKALGDGTALVVFRGPSGAGDRVRLVDAAAHTRWEVQLDGRCLRRSDDGIVEGVTDFAVRTLDRSDCNCARIELLSRSGEHRSHRLGTLAPDRSHTPEMAGLYLDGRFIESATTDDGFQLAILEPNGLPVSRPLQYAPAAVARAGDGLVLESLTDTLVDLHGNQTATYAGVGCTMGGKYWAGEHVGTQSALRQVETGRRIVISEGVADRAGVLHCVDRPNRMILFVMGLAVNAPRQLRVVDETGAIVASWQVADGSHYEWLQRDSLPRFVPLMTGMPRRFSVVDLDTGALQWEVPADWRELTIVQLGDAVNHWLIADQSTNPVVALVNGTTGKLERVRRLTADGGVQIRSPNQVNAAGLWLSTVRGITKLDPLTLEHLAGPKIQVSDARFSLDQPAN